MNKNCISIISIPNIIKSKISEKIYKKNYLVGYKKISNKNKVFIVELTNKTRIWMLKREIKLNTKLK
uniref:Cytochrome b6-f complex subunit PetP n=1 Tax=Bostrychia simpliciuscula TaxID=324754 RepID=A0A1Z1M8E6_9FLOR|nr:cytochrome b6-f complex subunit PetP [Bostrychia simpliciuscula]ARW62111.1 cytochrome b6-f complex subunit PetP [Bostrychia simpliciuscula]